MKSAALVLLFFSMTCFAEEHVVRSDEPLFRTGELGLGMQYAAQQVFNGAAQKCPTGFNVKEQMVRLEEGRTFLYWRIACSGLPITQSLPPATPAATAPTESR